MVRHFSYFSEDDLLVLKNEVFRILAEDGVKLDPHPALFPLLHKAGLSLDDGSGLLKISPERLEEALKAAPKNFTLGARNPQKALPLPRPGGGFYARNCTGGHSWLGADGQYHRVTVKDVETWGRLTSLLDEISFGSFLYPDDAPTYSADVHSMAAMIKNTDKHLWLQPYEAKNVDFLVRLAAACVGGYDNLKATTPYSFIACSVTPRVFKHMDLEIIYKAALAGLPIQACSLPGAGATSPITTAGTVALITAEILAMLVMAQAVNPGAPVVACPIMFSTDMRNGKSLQSSAEAIKGGTAAIQFIKAAFGLPTHNYALGSDASYPGQQNMAERSLLLMAKAMSGQDIMGGAGQLEVAICVSPLQLIADNELLAITQAVLSPVSTGTDELASAIIKKAKPGEQFITSPHTFKHCRKHLNPQDFSRLTRSAWEEAGRPAYEDALVDRYNKLMSGDNPGAAGPDLSREVDSIVAEADQALKY